MPTQALTANEFDHKQEADGLAPTNKPWSAVETTVCAVIAEKARHPETFMLNPEELHDQIDAAILRGIQLGVETMAHQWAERAIGAQRYQRVATRTSTLAGKREHLIPTPLGPVKIAIPRPRHGISRPEWLPAMKKAPQKIVATVRELWLRGLSTRDLSKVSEGIAGAGRSHTTVAEWVRDISDEVLNWLNRPIEDRFRFLVLDALYISVTRETAKKEPILVALGITNDGEKEILDVLHAPSESTESWSSLLARLKMRGLSKTHLRLVITDGGQGLIEAVGQQLPDVARQRCTVHKVRNVVGRCPRQLKKSAPAEAAQIYKAPSRDEARRRALAFIERYRETAPKIAAVIEDDLEATLAFFDFDATKWASLRSTNVLERLNRELRRKLREVGSMNGNRQAMRVAVQVSMFVNKEMRSVPVAGFRPKKKRKCAPTS